MIWLLLVLLVIVAAAVAVVALVAGARRTSLGGDPPRRRCVRCHGTGWLGREPERTLEFDGAGFADRHTPATMCPDCGGTGVTPAR